MVIVCLGLLGGGGDRRVCADSRAGLLLDSMLLQTLGVSSLVLLAAGYLAGRYREGFEISEPLVPPLLAGALTAMAAPSASRAIQLMLGVETQVSLLVVREIVVKGLLAFVSRSRSTRCCAGCCARRWSTLPPRPARRTRGRRSRPRRRGGPARMGGVSGRGRIRGRPP